MRIFELGTLNPQEELSILDTTSPASTKPSFLSLPNEVICLILDFIPPRAQKRLARVCLINRQWYIAAIPYLYRYPIITSVNYTKFVTTVSPSGIHVKPSRFAGLVKRIDLSCIVHESRPSLLARLLRRTQGSLKEFVAPQTAFGYIALVAVGKCQQLRLLDLSLVSQSIELEALFRHIQDLPHLVTLYFPPSSISDGRFNAFDKVLIICPHLEKLTIVRWLNLDSSGNLGVEIKITPDDIFIAVAEERLSELRVVRAGKKLGWGEKSKRMVVDLNELLETRAEEKGETGAGVWIFENDYSGQCEAFKGMWNGFGEEE